TISQSSSTFSWNGSDSDGTIAKYEYRKDGGTWTSNGTSTSYTWSGYLEDYHTFEVRAQDNEGAYSSTVSWSFTYSTGAVVVGEMVLVEGGTFTMGDEFGDLEDWCRPVHEVTLTYDFWLGKYEVTFDEYDAFCEATGRSKPDDWGWGRGTRPVMNVSWWDAIAYCNWLSSKEGLPVAYRLLGETDEGQILDANGNVTTDITKVVGYRLPTQAEWEYAARGGKYRSPYKYSGSDNVDEVAWYEENSGSKTHEIGLKLANVLGIYDMSGNVWEWCSDWWYYYTETPKTNPYSSTIDSYRMNRGGCWYFGATGPRVANRGYSDPTGTGSNLGLRICRMVY
ncbi:formylglycine-generating enzyme family protein, partial [Mesotoga sp. BH458_6_3_2_1]|uniref:formylglycine-generating enzyme family protein n=1 Tax=Mesotoga sp. BH458_6_3_2_1 TaxID=1437446 RepID=UPI000FF03E46